MSRAAVLGFNGVHRITRGDAYPMNFETADCRPAPPR